MLLEELLEVFLVVTILWLVRLRDFRAFLPQADPARLNGGDAEEGEEATDARDKPPCILVYLPGKVDEAMCLGVEVNNNQVTAFLDSLRKPRTVAGHVG